MLNLEGIEQQSIGKFTEQAYLDYAMYVILDRALPHIGDGLKPVQRRIVYAMSELNLSAAAKYKKSARTIGDVLGKFHPHGDSACYEAMVLMAQDFSYRYPLIDGQGNWGSSDDPKSFAAMRYTESRLAKYAEVLLKEVAQGTVDWANNFDGTMKEPTVLPSRLPNVLLNGTTGIAVGMATDIPPHNLKEIAKACIHLLDCPKATLSEVCRIVKAPDFPTDAEIVTPKADIKRIYQTGNGSIKMRAIYAKEGNDIVVTALPHMVSGAKILEQIAAQIQSKKMPLISDLRDESDHENPTRLVIVPRSNRVDADEIMAHLFATTDLEKNYKVNLNMIGLDGRPKVKNLLSILTEWLEFRKTTVKKRLQYRLDKVLARLHILDGFLVAYLNIDEVIKIIRTKDDPKAALIKKFKITDEQANAILDLKLRNLAKLEEMKIKGEQKALAKERDVLEKTLNSDARLKTLIKTEITEDMEAFGDKRRSPIVEREEAKVLEITTRVPVDPVTVVMSNKGWIRQGKGHELDLDKLNYKSGDSFKQSALGKSNELVAVLDSTGRSYSLMANSLPSVRGYGEPLTSKLTPEAGAIFEYIVMAEDSAKYLLMTDAGFGFITTFSEFITKNKKGKALMKLSDDAKILPPIKMPEDSKYLAMISNDGKLLVTTLEEVPELAKGKGKKLYSISSLNFAKGLRLDRAAVLGEKNTLVIQAGRKKYELKGKELTEYLGEINQRGLKLPKGAQNIKSIEVI